MTGWGKQTLSASSMCGLRRNCQTKKKNKKQGGEGGRGEGGEGVNLPTAAGSRRTEATCEDSGAPATRTLTNTGKGHVTAAQTAAIKQRPAACGVVTGHTQVDTLVVVFSTPLFPHVPLSRHLGFIYLDFFLYYSIKSHKKTKSPLCILLFFL